MRYCAAACTLLAVCVLGMTRAGAEDRPKPDALSAAFADPPQMARTRAYWWWICSHVTKAAITRDLEEMKAKGMGGALIFDAGGPAGPTPAGPPYLSAEWRELFKHAVKEADRLGLQLGLNIQSGWNLGGPCVTAEEGAKRVVFSQINVQGAQQFVGPIPQPKAVNGFYRDIAVVAYKTRDAAPASPAAQGDFQSITASSSQSAYPPVGAIGGSADGTAFWVSNGHSAGDGPSDKKPEWLQLTFNRAVAATELVLKGRAGHSPTDCQLQISDDGTTFRTIKTFTAKDAVENRIKFDEVRSAYFRVLITGAVDSRATAQPRNVQVADINLLFNGRRLCVASAARGGQHKPIRMFDIKACFGEFGGSAPDCSPLLMDDPDQPGEEDTASKDVIDLTSNMDKDGVLHWDAPQGSWQVLRCGYTCTGARVSTSSHGWGGLVLDYLDSDILRSYWKQAVEPLIADAGPLAGKSLRYFHTDSWECGGMSWTTHFEQEFRERRGYDIRPFLPVLAGRIVDSRSISNRFLADFRKTIGQCIALNHYRLMAQMAAEHGIGIHPESGGPHGAPVDALQCLGQSEIPMMEFWARAKTHRTTDQARLFSKQGASAAHIYGKTVNQAEAFTNIGHQWQESLWDNVKPTFDQEACEGMNLCVIHQFTCSPAEMGKPGQEYFAGMHFNPNITWWEQAGALIGYLNRCQAMLQQGLFAADACYYYGDNVPNFVQLKTADPAKVLPGYDYDVVNEDVILNRMSAVNGRLTLPDGMSYRMMVLPDRPMISPAVLAKLAALVEAGATVIGPRPDRATGLSDYPACDKQVKELADKMWGNCDGAAVTMHAHGKGRIFWGKTAREVLAADGIGPDFDFAGQEGAFLDYIHRTAGDAEIYFLVNRLARPEEVQCTFRVSGKTPELWMPDTGLKRFPMVYDEQGGRTRIPLRLDPNGSVFVIFRGAPSVHLTSMSRDGKKIFPAEPGQSCGAAADVTSPDGREIVLTTPESGRYAMVDSAGKTSETVVAPPPAALTIEGPWTVNFPKGWGAPESATFDALKSWTTDVNDGIKYFSGTAVYSREIDVPAQLLGKGKALWLDLGEVRELAQVIINGQDLGIVWKPPFRVDIRGAANAGKNRVEIRVTNNWPNRLIGDQHLPADKRFTRTTVTKFKQDSPLTPSGLLGPVKLIGIQEAPIGS